MELNTVIGQYMVTFDMANIYNMAFGLSTAANCWGTD